MTINEKNTTPDANELLESLRITKVQRRTSCGGSWVVGTIAGHRFDALVFPEHADRADFELGDSRISKLWLKHIDTQTTAANFDRDWDIRPTTPLAAAIVDVLAAGLAEHVFGN
ncbi:MAG: hypothetical protein LC121_21645 [Anaerolineae bacterium]|nr:hypothetical protein [Anaerolineae bacterium]